MNALGNTSFVPEGNIELNLGLYPHMLEPMEPVTLPSSNGTDFTLVNVTANGADFMVWDSESPSFIEGEPYVWFFKINDSPFVSWVLPKYPPVYWQHEDINKDWAINQASGSMSFEYKQVPGAKDVATFGIPYVSAELGETLRVVVNNPTMMAHPMHLHGQRFYLLGTGLDGPFFDPDTDTEKLNLENPIMMDTAYVPGMGWLVIEFQANNPGWWAFHCHIDAHFSAGMVMAFNVAEKEQPPPKPSQLCNPIMRNNAGSSSSSNDNPTSTMYEESSDSGVSTTNNSILQYACALVLSCALIIVL
jgi:hypothetical protein